MIVARKRGNPMREQNSAYDLLRPALVGSVRREPRPHWRRLMRVDWRFS